MQYSFLALAAAIGAVHAQSDVTVDAAELLSVVSILQTALPSSLIQDALTNSAGVASELVSQFAASATPSWFTALPSDVQTYLLPTGGVVANATAITSTAGPTSLATGTGGLIPGATNGTLLSNGTSSMTLTRTSTRVQTTLTDGATERETGSSSAEESGASSSSSSEAGASVPTAAVAMGFAGLAGVVGVLAL